MSRNGEQFERCSETGQDCPQQKCLLHLIRDLNAEILRNPYDQELKQMVDGFGHSDHGLLHHVARLGFGKPGLDGDGVDELPIGVKKVLPTAVIVPVAETMDQARPRDVRVSGVGNSDASCWHRHTFAGAGDFFQDSLSHGEKYFGGGQIVEQSFVASCWENPVS